MNDGGKSCFMNYCLTLCLLILPPLYSQVGGYDGGPAPKTICIPKSETAMVHARKLSLEWGPPAIHRDLPLFADPMGDGGINSPGKTLVNYVDLNSGTGLLDYQCGTVTYDGHQGTDVELLNFYDMDEGVPILCAAPGVVVYSHDGEYDRRTEWQSGTVANGVVVAHADGSEAWYWHMRKHSVRVEVGDTVATGDTLGLVGSSGYSSGPHLHFELQDGGTVDPYQGPCQPDSSRWLAQGDYVLDLPFDCMDDGLTVLPLSWALISERPPSKTHVTAPDTIYSWLRLRNVRADDQLTWKFYANGFFWNQYGFSPGETYASSWWYVWWILPTSATYFGSWRIEILRNDSLIAVQEFAYDAQENQLPVARDTLYVVFNDAPFQGEFAATDPDGSIFWYQVGISPEHGEFTQYGGRKRKFRYFPETDFTGLDTVVYYAVDDENIPGDSGLIVFDVRERQAALASTAMIPERLSVTPNYPNPFNPVTRFTYQLPRTERVEIALFDLSGRRVRTLVRGVVSAGTHTVLIDGSGLAAGVYFYRVRAGGQAVVNKCVLLK
jgi:hypothetical protein